jgi:hypothetical protein
MTLLCHLYILHVILTSPLILCLLCVKSYLHSANCCFFYIRKIRPLRGCLDHHVTVRPIHYCYHSYSFEIWLLQLSLFPYLPSSELNPLPFILNVALLKLSPGPQHSLTSLCLKLFSLAQNQRIHSVEDTSSLLAKFIKCINRSTFE